MNDVKGGKEGVNEEKSTTTRIAGGLDSPKRGRQGARSAKLPSASTAEGGGFYADNKKALHPKGKKCSKIKWIAGQSNGFANKL